MAKVTTARHDESPTTLEVERAGRRFPELPNTLRGNSRGQLRQLQTQQSEDSLPQQLASAIAKRLAWHEVRSDENTPRDTIVAAYIESLKQLDQFRQDVQRVVAMSCRANLEFRQETGHTHDEARDTILNKKLAEMLSQASSDWLPIKNIAGASLLSQPASVYRQQLDASITDAVNDFARQFFELLARLVDRELCGLVEWMPNHCCRYHFFRRVVIQEGETNTERVDVTQFDEPQPADDRGLMEVVGRRRTTKTKKIKHQIRYARHEHEVINAIRTSITNSNVVMPPNIVRLIESIPEWLYPFVEVIDGTIVRERIIERDVKVEDWTQVQIRDEPIMGYEPGVIIGQYVLSGWGPREVSQEQARRKAVEQATKQEVSHQFGPLFGAAAIGLSFISLWLLYRSLQGQGGFLFVVLATVAAIGSAWQAFFDFESTRRNPTAHHFAHCMAASAAFSLLLLEWLLTRTFYSLSWLTPVVLGAAAFISFHLGRQFK